MMDSIVEHLQKSLTAVGIENANFTKPQNRDLADICIPCFDLAQKQKANPSEIAKQIASDLKSLGLPDLVESAEAVGAYVNFKFSSSNLAKFILEGIDENYGATNIGEGKNILIEYPSQNTHKEFHIGHLRNICIGNTLVELYKKFGYNIIPINYVNDFGRHVVKCLWGINRFHKGENPEDNKQRWLGEVYTEANNYLKDHEDDSSLTTELDELQAKLEARDPVVMELFEKTKQWSVEGFEIIEKELKVKHEKIIYESEVKERGQEIVDELLEKSIAKVGEKGAIIVDMEDKKLGVALLRKSTGAGLYHTSDLALAEKKFKESDIEESINLTGIEQNMYFKQLFRILQLNGFDHKMTHIGYGLVNLPSGKMSSRSGNVILYEDLRDEVLRHMTKETEKRHTDWDKEKIQDVATVLTMAVLKFTMQKHEASKTITFDFDEAVSFEGFSAPYILYVVARINSLIRKSGIDFDDADYCMLTANEEKKLLLIMADFGEIITKAHKNYNTSLITKYCFDLAQAFNDFYNKYSILNADADDIITARLALSSAVRQVLVSALSLLTIDTCEEM